MKTASEIIVLHTTRLSDRKMVVHCIDRERGRCGLVCPVPGAGKGYMFQPMSILECELSQRPSSELLQAGNFFPKHRFDSIRSDFHKTSIVMFLSELLYRNICEGGAEDGLFEWCERELLTLEGLKSDFASFHLRFLVDFCGALGFAPTYADILPFAGGRAAELKYIIESDFAQSLLLPLSGEKRNEIATILLDYLAVHLGIRPEIRSLKVLRELYD